MYFFTRVAAVVLETLNVRVWYTRFALDIWSTKGTKYTLSELIFCGVYSIVVSKTLILTESPATNAVKVFVTVVANVIVNCCV